MNFEYLFPSLKQTSLHIEVFHVSYLNFALMKKLDLKNWVYNSVHNIL